MMNRDLVFYYIWKQYHAHLYDILLLLLCVWGCGVGGEVDETEWLAHGNVNVK